MCCGSHGTHIADRTDAEISRAQQAYAYANSLLLLHDALAKAERFRCWCRGYGSAEDMKLDDLHRAGADACRCDREITGEDMRCNRCRTVCELAWTVPHERRQAIA